MCLESICLSSFYKAKLELVAGLLLCSICYSKILQLKLMAIFFLQWIAIYAVRAPCGPKCCLVSCKNLLFLLPVLNHLLDKS